MDRRIIATFLAVLLCASTAWGRMSALVVGGFGQSSGSGVEILRPTSDLLTSSWTSSDGGSFYPDVDDTTSDNDSTYAYTTSNLIYCRFGVAATALTTQTITSITLKAVVRSAGANITWRPAIRHLSGATTYVGSDSAAIGQTYTQISHTWATNPHTSAAWQAVDIDDFGYAVAVVTSGGIEGRLTQLWIEVAYE